MTISKIKTNRLYFYNGSQQTIFKYYFLINETNVGEVTLTGEKLLRPEIHVWDRKNFYPKDLYLDNNKDTLAFFTKRMADYFIFLLSIKEYYNIKYISYFPSEIKRRVLKGWFENNEI